MLVTQAIEIVRDMEDRLQGKLYSKYKGLALSVEGQTHALIKVKLSQQPRSYN